MGAFEYTAVDPAGREQRGILEGDTARQVRQLLRDRQLLPLAVKPVAEKEVSRQRSSFTLRRGLPATDLALLTRQLATLVKSALPLEEALSAVSEQSESPRVRSLLLGVRTKVMEGHTLADSLGDFPQAFPELYRATVAAGEQSGHLDTVLERLADYTESRQALQQKISQAMIYPIFLVIFAVLIVSLLLVYAVPKITSVFANTGRDLPGLTVALIQASDFLQAWGLWLLLGVVAAGFWCRWVLRRPAPRRIFDRWLLGLPLVSKLVRGSNTARFTRTLSTLTSSGVPVLDALRIAAEVLTNVPMREAVEAAAERVREGAPIGRSLGVSGYFPPLCVHLISSGEASGELDTMLGRAASNQEQELQGLIGTLVNLLGPLVIVAMGALVLFIVLAMLMPIFEMNQLVR